jgi:hypothetical protein
VLLLSPIVPHACHALWTALGREGAVVDQPWPAADPAALVRTRWSWWCRCRASCAAGSASRAMPPEDEIRAAALAEGNVARFVAGKTVRKVMSCPAGSSTSWSEPMMHTRRAVVRLHAARPAACGFQLQGATSLPAELSAVYLDVPDPNSDLAFQLRRSLAAAGVTLVRGCRAEATATCQMPNERTAAGSSRCRPEPAHRVRGVLRGRVPRDTAERDAGAAPAARAHAHLSLQRARHPRQAAGRRPAARRWRARSPGSSRAGWRNSGNWRRDVV